MNIASFNEALTFSDKKIVVSVLLESSFTKEIRILLKKGQSMKEHKSPFAIVVHILEGEIDFGVAGTIHSMSKGSIIALEGNVPHDLSAQQDSVVRLTLSKLDKSERVATVAKDSI